MDEGQKKLHCYGKKFFAKWTEATAGQSSFSSITPEGKARYEELLAMAEEGRSEEGLKVEEAFLKRIRSDYGCTVWTPEERASAKRSNKAADEPRPKKPRRSIEETKKGFNGLFG